MRWSDERYVRVYTRDTIDWQSLSFIAQGLFVLLIRKVDRAGILPLGRHGKRGVATAIGFPGEWARLEPALEELLTDKCVTIEGDCLVVPNFIEAQEAPASDAQRKRDQRERDRDLASHGIPKRDHKSQNGTNSHGNAESVTLDGHVGSRTVPVESQSVTPNCAVPCLAEPPVPKKEEAATADADIRPGLVVEDESGDHAPMWESAQRFRRLVQDGMALTRLPAGSFSPDDWNNLDAKVIRVGGPKVAAAWTLDRLLSREPGKRTAKNLAYVAAVLSDMPDRPAEMVIPEATDERWAKVLDQARESMYPEHWNLLARCAGAVDGGTLRLTARDADHAETVRTRYAMLLENKTGYAVEVRP